eukprot:TRINITY_DN8904_c0_g2_i1.p1 TRINITY_DN8904_c0_g2~~TRINITY_DN8904_c0_g2_i1.p1  ORF type:complete len:467 (+),score=140.52 TRINITY_DN8904_c0_g2_i1:77-1402(+)
MQNWLHAGRPADLPEPPRPAGCPSRLWRLLLEDCSRECALDLLPHIGVLAALPVDSASSDVQRFLRHLNEVHCRAGASLAAEHAAQAATARAGQLEAVFAAQRRSMDPAQALRDQVERQRAAASADAAGAEVVHLRIQLDAMQLALEQQQQRLVDASAHWERQVQQAQERQMRELQAFQDERAQLRGALEAERQARAEDAKRSQELQSRLDATTEGLAQERRERETTKLSAKETRHSAEFTLGQMDEWLRRTTAIMQQQKEFELRELRRQLETERQGRVPSLRGGEPPSELTSDASRALSLVAALWHAAGRAEPLGLKGADVEREELAKEALAACRTYFAPANSGGAVFAAAAAATVTPRPQLLRPSDDLVSGPLRKLLGRPAAEAAASSWLPRPVASAYAAAPVPPAASLHSLPSTAASSTLAVGGGAAGGRGGGGPPPL